MVGQSSLEFSHEPEVVNLEGFEGFGKGGWKHTTTQPHIEGNLVGLMVPKLSHHLLQVTVHHGSDLTVLLVLVTL